MRSPRRTAPPLQLPAPLTPLSSPLKIEKLSELEDVAAANPDIVAKLLAEVAALQKGVWNPDRGNATRDGLACKTALGVGRGFWVPFLD